MKRLTLVFAFAFIALGAMAQQVEMTAQEAKGLTSGQASGAHFVGKKDGLTVIVSNVYYYMRADFSTGVAIYGLNEAGKAEKKLVVSITRNV